MRIGFSTESVASLCCGLAWMLSLIDGSSKEAPLLGRLLVSSGALTDDGLNAALAEQTRAGGRLGEILLAHGVDRNRVRDALAGQFGMATAGVGDEPVPLLSSQSAHRLRAVAEAPVPCR